MREINVSPATKRVKGSVLIEYRKCLFELFCELYLYSFSIGKPVFKGFTFYSFSTPLYLYHRVCFFLSRLSLLVLSLNLLN